MTDGCCLLWDFAEIREMSNQEEHDRLLQVEWREKVIPNLGGSQWIRVYQPGRTGLPEQVGFFCGLIPNANVLTSLQTYEWDVYIGEGVPGFMQSFDETGNCQTLYDRYGHLKHSIEPLVIVRSFHGLRPDEIEIAEEFRFFHNLFLDHDNKTYVKYDESGDIIPVVRMSDNFVDIRRKYIRQFLAVKEMTLVLYFERMYFSVKSLEQLDVEEDYEQFTSDNFTFNFIVRDNPVRWNGLQSQSWILGKTIIKGIPIEKCDFWPFEEEKQYEEFIIGVDDDDESIAYTSNPDELADYFGKNRHAPHYLTSVFFGRKVLAKYYNEPQIYSVDDGFLWCGGKWTLRMDNSHLNYVVVFLGDLGRDLPHKEQLHWKRYNVPPDGRMSETYFRRSFLNQPAEPEDSALRFRDAYSRFSRCWREESGWDLFKPLSEADSHHLTTLHRPFTSESSELDRLVLSLSKLLVDSTNVRKIKNEIPDFEIKDTRGIKKKSLTILEEYLVQRDFVDSGNYIECLRIVQDIRSASAAHRKGRKFQRVSKSVGLDSRTTQQIADEIFNTLTDFLDSLRKHFCPNGSD
ncbi:MAG: hypothetical protein OXI77_04000 [Chloroflexota bacterium]|nr:hypothetical protein [Chloroflexota bacterium]MDE2910935.1 hypothetical protein [Chloroflexota bacterium]